MRYNHLTLLTWRARAGYSHHMSERPTPLATGDPVPNPLRPRDTPDALHPQAPDEEHEPRRDADEPTGGRVVVGIDGSPESRAALHWAVRHARAAGVGVHAVAVWHRPIQFADGPPLPAEEFETDARRWLSDALPELAHDEAGVPVQTSIDEGDPAERLLEHTHREDLLVLGNRGRGPFAATLMGSVALRCAHQARCPVVLVPDPDPAHTRTSQIGD